MKNLEEALKACHKPEIAVPEFKAALHRELCRRIDVRNRGWDTSNPWNAPIFFGLGALVFGFAALVTLFIVFPKLPQKLNYMAGISQKEIPVEIKLPDFDMKSAVPSNYRTVFSPEGDKVFAQQWIRQNYPQITSQVAGIEGEKIVTLRWVRLDNGRKILVMNEFSPQRLKKSTRYNQIDTGGVL